MPSGYWAFVPAPLEPLLVWTSRLVGTLSEADRALGELAGLGRTLPNPHLLVRPFVRREAVLSSRIEGTRASLDDLLAFEAQALPTPELAPDVREVHNYVTALDYGLERLATLPLSLRLVRELHARLLQGVRGAEWTPGEFRRSPNWIGPPGSTLETAPYVPPPPAEMDAAMADLERFWHAGSDLPPLLQLGMIHYQFEAIHPFLDGNGRVGRLLLSLISVAWGLVPQPLLYLSVYFEAHRQEYYDRLMAVSQTSAWEEWLVFFLTGVSVQARDAVSRLRRLYELRSDYRSRFQTARAAARLLQVVDLLFGKPVITHRQLQSDLQVEFRVAGRYIEQLVGAGVLREITGRTRNRVYQADEILHLIQGPA